MSGQQLANQRKRQRTEHPQLHSKRQKLSHQSASHSSSDFWDDLSKIWLTKYALRELDRRNAKLPQQSLHQQRLHRPVTRKFLAELKKPHKSTQSASNFLRSCTAKTLKDIWVFARHGGPDLSDLRGVSILGHLTCCARADKDYLVSRACLFS
jgi:hypothetical protein